MSETPDDSKIRSYLLGDMPAEDRAAFQKRIFDDDELFLRVVAVETDLADALARGELPPAEAARVRAFLEESSQQDRIATAHALALREHRTSKHSPWPRALLVAATVLITVGAIWLAFRNSQLQTQIAQTPPASQRTANIFSTRIPAGTLRGSAPRPAISLPHDVRTVELLLEVRSPGNHSRYRVDVTRGTGEPVLSFNIPAPLPAELPVPIPRAALSPGVYEITLSAFDPSQAPIDYYYCTVR